MSVLKLENVTKIYGTGHTAVVALRNGSLSVKEREIVLIMGPSGSGKTTLLSMAGGMLTPTSGEISLGDINITALDERELPLIRLKHIGFIFQSFNLLSALTVFENVRLILDLSGMSKEEGNKRASALLEKEGLKDKLHRFPRELSGGEMQRVSIARALVNNPDIILADEPTANLDSKNGHRVMMSLRELAKEKGKSIIIVSHDQRIMDIADRILWLEDGELNDKQRSNDELFKDPVCKLFVEKAEADYTSTYKKKKYYFCSKTCKEQFDQKPLSYK